MKGIWVFRWIQRHLHVSYVASVYKQDNLDLRGLKGLILQIEGSVVLHLIVPVWTNVSLGHFPAEAIFVLLSFWWDDNGFHRFCQTWRELQLLCAFEFVPGDWIGWNPQAFGGFRWMQTLTSSEKVYLGTDLVDVVYFFWFSFILPSHCLQAWREIPSPFHTESLQSWKPESTCWPHIKLGKYWSNYRLKSHKRSLI